MKYTYENAVALLTSVGKFHISLGLDRMEQILELLGNPQEKLNCIHVAGTNGKGSVCSILTAILAESGKKVGLYTSPHIFKYTERIQILSSPHPIPLPIGAKVSGYIPDDVFARYVFEISNLAEKNNIDLTEFEILTAVMFKYFADNKVDVVVLETCLGGRFDATKDITRNLCSVITHIDFDHTERLGDTLEKISFEKAGIIKPDCPCISFESLINAKRPDVKIDEFIDYLSLRGKYQHENLALALSVIKEVFPEIGNDIIKEGLKKVKHPCRFQYIKEKNLIIDGAHNPNGIEALRTSLDEFFPNVKRRFIFGCLKNKDYKKMLGLLFKEDDEIYFYHFSHSNSCDYHELQAECPIKACELTSEVRINFNDGKLNIICGSFYMISELAQKFDILRNI